MTRPGLLHLALALFLVASASPASGARPRRKPKPQAPAPAVDQGGSAPSAGGAVRASPPAPPPPAAPATSEPAAAPAAPAAPATPDPAPAEKTPAPVDLAAEVQALRKEYEGVRDELFRSRARAAAVGSALYSSRLEIGVRHVATRFQGLRRVAIRLDGASVFEDASGAPMTDDAIRFQGWVAPGTHQLTFHIEAQAKDDDRFVTTLEDTLTIDVPADHAVTVRAKLDDGGDMAYAWKRKQKGTYRLRLDVDAAARRLPGAAPASTGKGAAK